MQKERFALMLLMQLGLVCATGLRAQVQTVVPAAVPGAKPAKVEQITVHGASLEGNLEDDAVDRPVIVYLPPSYATDKRRRYPVVYALHGYSIGAEQWSKEIHVPQTIEGAFAQGAQEMIVVLPDSKTAHNGSMYSSSITTGDFEQFIAKDVVAYVDAHYRTIPSRASRGLVGHSMGGYGATRIGMKHADVFGSLYIMSPCCLSAPKIGPAASELEKAEQNMKTPADSASLPLSISTSAICVTIRESQWTSAARTGSRSTPPSSTKYSISTVCKTASRSTREPTRVRSPIAFRIT